MVLPISKPNLSDLERKYLLEAFDSGWIGSSSSFVTRTEHLLSRIIGADDALLVSNGSVALTLALRALGLGLGDEVIVPALTYAATASSVVNVGASPVFCDVDRQSWQMSPESIRQAIGPETKAVIVPHTYGVPAPMKEILHLGRSFGLKVIEDCAEALGAHVGDTHVGTLADVGTFSFFPNKLISSGEGGLVVAKDQNILNRMRLLRGQGMSTTRRYVFEEAGYNFRISGLQAAVLLAQTERYPELLKARKSSESSLDSSLEEFITVPTLSSGDTRAPWIYSGRLKTEKEGANLSLAAALAERGIETRPVFWPLNSMEPFARFRSMNTTNARDIARSSISLPSGPHVTHRDISIIRDETLRISLEL